MKSETWPHPGTHTPQSCKTLHIFMSARIHIYLSIRKLYLCKVLHALEPGFGQPIALEWGIPEYRVRGGSVSHREPDFYSYAGKAAFE